MSTESSPPLRISQKRRRLEAQGITPVERLQCEFIIKAKNKRCPLTRAKDVEFCAEHLKQREGDKRIACPVDPRHTVWEREVKGHVKRCAAKIEAQKDKPWFMLNHNCNAPVEGNKDSAGSIELVLEYSKWAEVVNKAHEEFEPLVLEQLHHDGVQERLEEKQNQKHAIQQSSLISHLDQNGLLSKDLHYIEWGCGKAELSRYLLKSVMHKDHAPADFLLIDRSPMRMKQDGKMIKDVEDAGQKNKIFRVRIDIKDVFVDAIIDQEFNDKKDFVGVSKHLCGAATDLTIQCIERNPELQRRMGGMIVAMCCRHCCNYDMFPVKGKQFLSERGIDELGFRHLMKFASWAVSGMRPNMDESDGSDHPSGLTIKERRELGLRARRLIDEARKYTMESMGYKVKLCHYVPLDVSLENTCMIVTK
ncbi:CYFA0S07e01222g1_1 [Cyberlindnera fabianii]|uniref:tRNA:m(4)X modification enzyme TRM13 n=1 Tax=Cyberlindnera fabianii TaxID=36022 RepID=A0A061AUQ3_CYBFA|nr:CYFA0S07e01222g1_1 [Cyberlindnera fabianii]